ncbi:MAG: hypothetical protein U5R14_04800 [Gemmatimonadota bacterium]|nr:hypothetical protein [Gemmatimonadota bacterium]
MSLHPLFGHTDARRTILTSYGAGRLPSSLLLHGAKGVGKQRFALWIAQLTVCEKPDLDEGPCGTCQSCRLLLTLEHPDIHWYMPLARPKATGDRLADALEDARHDMLARYRETPLRPTRAQDVTGLYIGTVKNLRKRAHVRASMAVGPVFIIGDAELLVPQEASQEAANALLKLLEEPPGSARFILTSSVPGSLLPTVRSRTVPLHLGPLPDGTVRSVLVDRLDVDEERARSVAKLARGSLGRALGFLPQDEDEDDEPMNALRREAFAILRAALDRERADAHTVALAYPSSRARGLLAMLDVLDEWIRDLGAVLAGSSGPVFHHDAAEPLAKLASRSGVHAPAVPGALPVVEKARELARGNVNPQLVVAGLVKELGDTLLPPFRGSAS